MATDAKIAPALTAEEWAKLETGGGRGCVFIDDVTGTVDVVSDLSGDPCEIYDRHGAAALCLHNQPFGFTREDVVRHREEARWERECAEEDPTNPCAKGLASADWHDSMADRLEALLPPED